MSQTNADLTMLFTNAYAVIWDMDGVLVDSESYHFASHKKALAEAGVPITEHYYINHGVATDPQLFYTKAFADNGKALTDALFLRVHYRKLDLYQQLQRERGIKVIPPALAIVKRLYAQGMLMAIASQVDREEVVRNLKGTELLEYFPVIVAGGDFGLPKKPASDIYRKASELLNVPTSKCVAIEDSKSGAQSAVGAGIPCIVVTNKHTQHQSFPPEVIQSTFADITHVI